MKKSVLLVDDSNIDNFINQKVMSSLGLVREIHTALNGEQALQVFNQYQNGVIAIPDVILLDLNMPVMDGFGFIQAFQSLNFPHKENVLIIVLTSSSNSDDMNRVKQLGIKHYLTKPLTQESIQSILNQEFSNQKCA
jgi:CheY-like chemotaxis protein